MKNVMLCVLLFAAQTSWAHRVGNGGDHIRATFIQVGESVLDYLKDTEAGHRVAVSAGLNVDSLRSTLDIEKIQVVDQPLRDNSGSIVDALGQPGSIQLQKEAWFNHFEKNQDVTYLVFHEMLRSASINDDNYVVSKALNPFPLSLRVQTKVVPVLPLIEEDLLSGIFDLNQVQYGGPGCSPNQSLTRLDFNAEKNILEIDLSAYRNDVWKGRPQDRKSCSLTIPVNLPKNKRLVISQIDLLGKVDLQGGSQTQLEFEAFLAGQSNTLKTRRVQPTKDLKGRLLTRRTEVLKSRCGASDLVRLNTSLLTKGSEQRIETTEVDEMSLYLSLEDCKL